MFLLNNHHGAVAKWEGGSLQNCYYVGSIPARALFASILLPFDTDQRIAIIVSIIMRSVVFSFLVLVILGEGIFCKAFGQIMGVEDVVELALEKNTSLINAEKTRQIYEYRIKEYYGEVYPNITLSASYSRNLEIPSFFINGQKVKIGSDNEYFFTAELEQNLYTGGAVGAGIKIAGLYANIGTQQKRAVKNDLVRNVRNLFFDVLLSAFTVEVQRETYDIAKQHLKQMEDKYKQGLASDLNVLRQKVEVSNLAPDVIEAESIYKIGILNLNNLIGNDPEVELTLRFDEEVPELEIPNEIEILYKKALSQRPEAKIAELTYDMSVENIKVAKSAFYPEIKLFANRTFSGQTNATFPDENERYWSSALGLKFKWNIFSGGADAARVKEAGLEAEKNYESYAEMKRLIKIDVKKYWLDYQKALELVISQREAVSRAKKALSATEVRFKNGLSSQLELNDAVLALNKSRLLEITAVNEKCKAICNLIWAIGGNFDED